MDTRTIKFVTKWHRPLEIGRLWSFLGLCNYFLRFTILKPYLVTLTQSKTKCIWTHDCEFTFENVEVVLIHASILTLPKLVELFEVVNDVSLLRARAIPLQGGRPNAFESRNRPICERNYAIVHIM